MPVLVRVTIVALAAVLSIWFGLGVIQARDTTHATSLITGSQPLTIAQLQRARSLLNSAATLNPDQTVEILRGVLANDAHNPAAGERTLLAVTRREPLNLDAWVQLALVAARNHDLATVAIAGRHASELHPKIP